MNKKRYDQFIAKQRKLNENKVCEWCGKQHDHSYGSGRFCCKSCRMSYIASKNKGKAKLHKRKTFGTWKCEFCEQIFSTHAELNEHINNCHAEEVKAKHKLAVKEGHKKRVQTIRKNIAKGLYTPKGHPVSAKTKVKLRKAALRTLERIKPGTRPNYNTRSIAYLDQLSFERGWHLQHAENGGEYNTGIGYFIDAYDKDLNIVVEYDEPAHYIGDITTNTLRPKDIERQNNIIDLLHCTFYRYNEATGILWCVNP